MKDINEKLSQIFINILGVAISEDEDPERIENWDSLNHLNIILSIEEEFKIEIPPEDFEELYSTKKKIIEYIKTKIK